MCVCVCVCERERERERERGCVNEHFHACVFVCVNEQDDFRKQYNINTSMRDRKREREFCISCSAKCTD